MGKLDNTAIVFLAGLIVAVLLVFIMSDRNALGGSTQAESTTQDPYRVVQENCDPDHDITIRGAYDYDTNSIRMTFFCTAMPTGEGG